MTEQFPRNWSAEVLHTPPLIAPARHYTWPRQIPGEEDALARGALQLLIRPAADRQRGGSYLVTCALGFTSPALPTGIWSCPSPAEICAVAGGYAYLADTGEPERCILLELKPVVEVIPAIDPRLLLFIGFDRILAWGANGQAWITPRVSWEGIRVVGIYAGQLTGYGWDLMADREVEFRIALSTGTVTGGPFQPAT